MHKGLMAVGAIAVAGASAAVGWFGVKWLFSSDPVAAPTTAPTASAPASDTVRLTFNVSQVAQEADGLFSPPLCGETWDSAATPANGVTPTVDVTVQGDNAQATVSFASADPNTSAFLAQEGQLIVTRDGQVVTPDWGTEFVPGLYLTTGGQSASAAEVVSINGSDLCDVSEELSELWDDFDWENASDEEINARYEEAAALEALHATLPPGEYKVYAWSPIILGDSAAAARALVEEGITDLAYLQYTAGYSPLVDDERIAPYCRDEDTPDGATEKLCDVPQDVLAEVLERDVPASYVVDAPAAVAISEAASFTIAE